MSDEKIKVAREAFGKEVVCADPANKSRYIIGRLVLASPDWRWLGLEVDNHGTRVAVEVDSLKIRHVFGKGTHRAGMREFLKQEQDTPPLNRAMAKETFPETHDASFPETPTTQAGAGDSAKEEPAPGGGKVKRKVQSKDPE